MADPVRTTECLQALRFSELDKQWVDAVWEEDFTEKRELPPGLAEHVADSRHYVRQLQRAVRACTPWARIDFATLPQGFWSVLAESGLSARSLLALLHSFMCGVDKVLSTAILRETAILSANLYFILNEIPGSGAYKIFHPLVFQEALDLLKQCPDPATASKRKRIASGPSSSQAGQGQRGSKARRLEAARNDDGDDNCPEKRTLFDDDDDEDGDGAIVVLTPQETSHIRTAVLGALTDFVYLLRNSTFKDAEQTIERAMQVLSELTRVTGDEREMTEFDSTATPSACTSVIQVAYLGLAALCSTSHGDVTDMFRLVLKHLMPNLLMLMGEDETVATATIPRAIQLIKDNSIAFVRRVAVDLEAKAVTSLRVLLQHLCMRVPEKAEYRAKTAQTVALILKSMPSEHRAKFVDWLYKYSQTIKIGHRVFAMEVVAVLLEQSPQDQAGTPATTGTPTGTPAAAAPAGDAYQQYLSPTFLTQMLLSRCSDRAPTVRTKALTCFAEFTTSADPSIRQALQELFYPSVTPTTTPAPVLEALSDLPLQAGAATPGSGNHDDPSHANQSGDLGEVAQDGATPGNLMGGSPALLLEISGGSSGEPVGKNIIVMLRTRARDEKVGVRKAALQALENILRLNGSTFTTEDLQVFQDATRDPGLSVRKQAIVSLTSLLTEKTTCAPLQKVWLQSVLPGVVDREETAQEKFLQVLKELLLDGIVARNHSGNNFSVLSWDLLGILAQQDSGELRRYLAMACQLWSKQKVVFSKAVRALTSHINHENDQAAWLLLAEVAPHCPSFDTAVIREAWDQYKWSVSPVQLVTLQRVLSVMGSLAGRLGKDVQREMVADMKARLMKFDASAELSRSLVTTVYKMCLSVDGTADKTSALMATVSDDVMEACKAYLSGIVLTEGPSQKAVCEDTLVRYLDTLGEVARLCPGRTPRRLFMLVQSLFAGPKRSEGDSLPGSQQLSQSQPLPLSQFGGQGGQALSDTVRAHVFVTLGKLCLMHEGLAKQCVPAMARELETSASFAVRNNVAIILCDLCIRYPNLVDRYMANISMCFQDDAQIVRKQSLTMLTRLLLGDYVKWRGPLFFHYVTSLVDDVKEIREFAEYSLVQLFLKRHPNLLHQHFVEAVFHFNEYNKHKVYNQFSQTDRERRLFSLKGAPNASKRRTIYHFMLQHMTDEHRFKLTAKLCQEVLAAIVDGVLPLNDETNCLMQDTLDILCCKEIKLSSLRPSRATSDIDDQMEMAKVVLHQAKTKLITQVVKRNVIENIVPIVIALKHALEKAHSPTLGPLMMYLKLLMKDYRNEVKDILAADRQLAAEIEFDLRRFEEEQAEAGRRQKEAASAPAIAWPGSRPATPGSKPAMPRSRPATPLQSPLNLRDVCSPRIIRSPRHFSVATPLGTPHGASDKPATPLRVTVEPGADDGLPATPARANRPMALATQAIVNSARRAIALSKRCPPIQSSATLPARQPGEVVPGSLDPVFAAGTEDRPPLKEKTPSAGQNKTPPRRAISTPDKTIANITFHCPTDLSFISQSPIPSSLPIRICSDVDPKKTERTASSTPQLEEGSQKDLLVMFSPDKPTPKPRKWAVTPAKEGPRHAQGGKTVPQGDKAEPSTSSKDLRKCRRRSARLLKKQK